MIRRQNIAATLAMGTLAGLGFMITGAQPAAARSRCASAAYRTSPAPYYYGSSYGSWYDRGRYDTGYWGSSARRGIFDLDRDGIHNRLDRDRDGDGVRNRRDRDRDGDGVRNERDDHPKNPRRH